MTWFLFCYWYEPDAPGDPVGLVRIWRIAQQLHRMGDRVTVFPPRYASAENQSGFELRTIPLLHWPILRPLSYTIGSFLASLLAAIKNQPAVVYYRWMLSPHPIVIARLFGCPCVCEVNGEPVPDWAPEQAGFRKRVQHWLARQALRRCDRLVVLTEGLRDLVISRYGVSPHRLMVIASGTDTELFSPRTRSDCRRLVGLDPDAEYIGFVGSFYRYQGIATLLAAFAMLRACRPRLRLLLVGDGETAQDLREEVKRLGITDAVSWTGRVPYAQVPVLIGAMDVCAAPFCANRGETSPVKLFDYLACERPVVASAIPSVLRVFSEGHGVMLVPPDDPEALAMALRHVLDNRGLAVDMGRQGRRFVEQQHGWAALTTKLREGILQQYPASPPPHANLGVL